MGEKTKHGGMFKDELDAAKRVNQLCEKLGNPLQNPEINATPNQQYYEREKTSQYKGVSWHKKTKMWRVRLRVCKGGKVKFGGMFKDELDAAKKVNQLCEEFGIRLKNPEISTKPNQQYKHDGEKTIENPVISAEIFKTDNDDANKNKRKREKEFKDDDKLPVNRHYFYDYLLK